MKRDHKKAVPRLVYLLNRYAGAYARQVLAPHALTKEQVFYLSSLVNDGDGITQEELAARLHTDKSSTARMVASLDRRGLVSRRRVTGNARAYSVRLTPRARRLWQTILPKLWTWHDTLCRGFTRAEIHDAIALLGRMRENAEAASCTEVRPR